MNTSHHHHGAPDVQSTSTTRTQDPYYIHTANGLEAATPSPRPSSRTQPQEQPRIVSSSPEDDTPTPLINPRHPSSVCPPSTSRWQQLKADNEERKSREVTRVSCDEAARITGRDGAGFRTSGDGAWTRAQREREMRRVWECVAM